MQRDAISAVYLDAASKAADLIASAPVTAKWNEPSALAEFAVSGLAGHLAWQVIGTSARLNDAASGTTIGILDHYARSAWVGAPLDAETNVQIRMNGEAEAADGPVMLASRMRDVIRELAALLPDAKATVYLPWNGWALTLEDFAAAGTAVMGSDGRASPQLAATMRRPSR